MEPQGLAQQGQGQDGDQGQDILMQIVKLLMQGVKPEELQAKGVPPEVIQQAMQMAQAQMQQGQGQPQQGMPQQQAPMGQGLAGSQIPQGGM